MQLDELHSVLPILAHRSRNRIKALERGLIYSRMGFQELPTSWFFIGSVLAIFRRVKTLRNKKHLEARKSQHEERLC